MNLLIKMKCKQNVKYQQEAQLSQSAMRRRLILLIKVFDLIQNSISFHVV